MCSLANPTQARFKNLLLTSQENTEASASPDKVEGSSEADNHGVVSRAQVSCAVEFVDHLAYSVHCIKLVSKKNSVSLFSTSLVQASPIRIHSCSINILAIVRSHAEAAPMLEPELLVSESPFLRMRNVLFDRSMIRDSSHERLRPHRLV